MNHLHPDLAAFLDLVNASDKPPMSELGVAQARELYDASTLMIDAPGETSAIALDLSIPCRDGARIGARLYKPDTDATSQPVVLFFHGGGYVLGGLDSHDSLCEAMAVNTPCAVLAVDYRLAPEHKFPTAFHDAEDALQWLRSHGAAHGLDVDNMAVVGDSVGGSLATALTLSIRDGGKRLPCIQILLYPCINGHQSSESHKRFWAGYLLEGDTLRWMYANYLRHDDDRQDWRFAPAHASDLQGLPPALIILGDHDPLLDEGLLYADMLKKAQVPTELKIYEGMIHDFARLGNIVDEAHHVRLAIARALRAAFQLPAEH
ncbi:MAG: alpha/beta hydrolase [Aquabacterium sp.]